ncbi:MAG: molybdopterin-dependent oxidoreductase [Bryobacteraceae bacterium]|nr:molybdopterin-dependent oxidoreductase [Bryobacteraceae bacterium]
MIPKVEPPEMDPKAEYIRQWQGETCDEKDFHFQISRRELAGLGLGVVVSLLRPSSARADEVLARIHVGDGGGITLFTGKVEMGQGTRTILTQVVAEEMQVAPSTVKVVMGDTLLVPDDGGTWGSLTAPVTVPVIRAAAASARKATAPVDPSDWKVCGTSLLPVSGRDIVTGRLKYATDLNREHPGLQDLLHGAVVRPTGHKAKLVRFSSPSTVKRVRDGDFAGVIAKTRDQARGQAAAADVQWNLETLPSLDEMYGQFRKTATAPKAGEGGRYPALVKSGDIFDGFNESERTFEALYTLPNIAHVPLEPRAAIAQWTGRKLTVWSGTQAPFLVRKELAAAFRVAESDVRVIACDVGGGYGGKQRGECEIEASKLAQEAEGRPVKLAWSREEEFTASYSRPAGVIEMKAGIDETGRIHSWQHLNFNAGAASLTPPYAIPHLSCEFHRAQAPLRQGSYRSLAGVANTFAREMHVDEIATSLNADPLEYRFRNVEDDRLKAVLKAGAERFGWTRKKAFGVACNLEKEGRYALFTEIRPDLSGALRMVLAMDVGAILNPDMLRNQAAGALIQGIGGALWEQLQFDSRQITTTKLSQYRVPRFADLPAIEVVLIDRRDIPSAGAGEAPITLVAPALGSAMRTISGGAHRSLPLLPSKALTSKKKPA